MKLKGSDGESFEAPTGRAARVYEAYRVAISAVDGADVPTRIESMEDSKGTLEVVWAEFPSCTDMAMMSAAWEMSANEYEVWHYWGGVEIARMTGGSECIFHAGTAERAMLIEHKRLCERCEKFVR